jgi:hypothetical protein
MADALSTLLRGFTRELEEVFTNAIASAADDALERVEGRVQTGLGRIRRARGVAQRRKNRGRNTRG